MSGLTRSCILFDLGGTLWSRNRADWRAVTAISHRVAGSLVRQLNPTSIELRRHGDVNLGRHVYEHLTRRRRDLITQSPGVEPEGAAVVGQVLNELGLGHAGEPWNQALFSAFDMPVHLTRELFVDTHAGLSLLRARGFGVGVVTNRFWGGPAFMEGMRALGLLNYFDPCKMAVSADLRIRKPEGEIFQHALDAHQVREEEAAMVGNSLAADMLGARRAGILAVWKPHGRALLHARTHLAENGLSISEYNSGRRPSPRPPSSRPNVEPAEEARERAELWMPFMDGTVMPDLIVESTTDLASLLAW
jgi:FMN phosphatase YigB (HAD superfamily)